MPGQNTAPSCEKELPCQFACATAPNRYSSAFSRPNALRPNSLEKGYLGSL
jgi:hypothetical protein